MRRFNSTAILLFGAFAVSGCAVDVRDIGRAPLMTPVGAGLTPTAVLPANLMSREEQYRSSRSLWEGSGDLYRDARASRIGDLVTVIISINDRASFGNASERSRDATINGSVDASSKHSPWPGSFDGKLNAVGETATKGLGKINRFEQIQLSVAAVITDILPNGNLLISGSQEVRVNFELRELHVSGIVRSRDISRDNTVAYDKIAEARISYGGRGRAMEVQQPALIHQIYDLISPF